MLKIIEITNSFEPAKNRKIKEVEWKGKKLCDLIPLYLDDPIVFVNQLRVYDFGIIPADNSEIVISPKQKVSAIAAGIFSLFTGEAAIATTWATMTIGSALAYVAAAAVVMAGSSLLSSVLTPQMPNNQIQNISESPTYSWNESKTMARTGSPVPVLFGKHALVGNIIQRKIDYNGDDEYLNLLLALCMGETKEIENGDIYINNSPITDYEDVEFWYRQGTLTQDTIPHFSDIETPNAFDVELDSTPVVRETIGDANEAIKIFLQFPNGLYYQNDKGGLDTRAIKLKIEYRKIGSSTWINLPKYYRYLDHYECERYNNKTVTLGTITKIKANTCDKNSKTFWENCPDPKPYPSFFGISYSKINLPCATGRRRTVYSTKIVPWEFSAAQTTSFSRMIEIRDLDPAKYEVRITRLTPTSTNPRLQTTCKWIGMGEIIYADLIYPTVSLLGLRIKATGQLSGEVTVKTLVQRSDIEVFDENGVSQGLKRLDNPAWVFWDILTNKLYGYGLSYDKIDYSALKEWADWCDEYVPAQLEDWAEPRYRFDGVFDFEGNIWDALVKVATVGRAAPIIKGTKYSVVVDKTTIMTQIFNMGNIVKSSLKISYISKEDLANEVEVQFTNKDNNYTNDTVTIVAPEWFSRDLQTKKTTINQIGIIRQTQAYRVGRYFLNNNANTRRTAEFDVGLDALDSEIGDVIGLSHDVPAWGQSGRVETATSTTANLDREVILSSANEYEITIRHLDNSIETFDVEASKDETTNKVTILGSFTQIPKKYDIYSIVEKAKGINLFRITSITRKDDFTRSIKAVEYNEKVVSDVPDVYPSSSKSELILENKIKEITISEHLLKKNDGSIVSFLDFSWEVENNNIYTVYDIYYSDNSKNYFLIAKDIKTRYFTYLATGIDEGKEYFYKIVCRGLFSNTSNNYLLKKYTLYGKETPPKEIENIKTSWSNGKIILSWDKNKEVDFNYYEIIIQGNIYRTTTNSLTIDNLSAGDYTVEAYAIDTTQNKSTAVFYALHVVQPCIIYLIRDSYLIEKAFMDGSMTIYTSLAPPPVPNMYDIWKVSVENISISDFTYESDILHKVAWDVGVSLELYKYWNGYGWILCTTEQTATVKRMLGQLTSAGIEDNNVKVFNVEPYTPYSKNDLWIDGLNIKICLNDKTATETFDAKDWVLSKKEAITIASKIENIRK